MSGCDGSMQLMHRSSNEVYFAQAVNVTGCKTALHVPISCANINFIYIDKTKT